MSLNSCNFCGRLTEPPTGGQTNKGNSFARFSIAVQRNYKNNDGQHDADYFNCVVFGASADYLMKYGGQGDKINVSGEMHNNDWVDQNGNKRRDQQLTVNNIEIVAHPQKGQVSRRHYENQQQSYQNNQQGNQQGGGQQPQQQYQQQEMDTGNGWDNTPAGQKRNQMNNQRGQQPANDKPVEINDDSLPF